MSSFGYVRVSSRDQNEARQLDAMKEQGIAEDHIFLDKQTGSHFRRPGYRKLLKVLQPDDVLFIKSIDRLGRNYVEIQEEWRHLARDLQVDIVVLDMPLLDTRRGKDLMGTFLSDIVLQVLSFVAENERENIRKRQAEGIVAAKARGVKFGRPTVDMPDNFKEVCILWEERAISLRDAAEACHTSVSTFRRRYQEYVENHPQGMMSEREIFPCDWMGSITSQPTSPPVLPLSS